MKKKLFCLFLCLSLAGIFSGCGEDLFKIQGKVYDTPSATDENSVILEYRNIEQTCNSVRFYNSLIIQHQI